MNTTSSGGRASRVPRLRALPAFACAVAVSCLAYAPAAIAGTPDASATLEQCVTAATQSERSATFAGEMTALPGTARMQIRVELFERVPGEGQYRAVSAPDLGVWQGSAAGVKTFKHIQQVSNLSAPAFYRGVVGFRWLSARGRQIKIEELRTSRCEQPLAPSTGATTTASSDQ